VPIPHISRQNPGAAGKQYQRNNEESVIMSMFAPLFIRFMEKALTGKPVQTMLAEMTGISRKTWDTGGPKRPAAKERAAQQIEIAGRQQLRDKGLSDEAIEAWLSRFPMATDEEPYSLSLMIKMFSPSLEDFPETLELAKGLDELAHALSGAKRHNDIAAYKGVLLNEPLLEKSYFANDDQELSMEGTPAALASLQLDLTWEELESSTKIVTAQALFSLMACWDLEFCRSYTPSMQAFPFFETVMLHTEHEFQEKQKVSRDMFHRPTRNLLDFLASMGDWVRNCGKKKPRKVKVQQMATWLELGEPQIPRQKLWNWRRGRDAFLFEDFALVWQRFTGAGEDKEIPYPPTPLFAASQMWEVFLVQPDNKKKTKTLLLVQPWYLWWWEHHHARLLAKGVTWGNRPWPACIRNQSSWSGAKSSGSSLSSQSSGRSSKSLDSQ